MLIMAIKDSDIPFILIKSDQKKARSILHRLSIFFNMIVFQATVASYILLANFAATAQDIIVQVLTIAGVGLGFIGIVVFGQQETYIAAILSGFAFLLIVALVMWETWSPGDNLSDVQVEEERLTMLVREMSFTSRQRVAQELLQQPSERLQTTLETIVTVPVSTRQEATQLRRLSPVPQPASLATTLPVSAPAIVVPAHEVAPRRPSPATVTISLDGDDSDVLVRRAAPSRGLLGAVGSLFGGLFQSNQPSTSTLPSINTGLPVIASTAPDQNPVVTRTPPSDAPLSQAVDLRAEPVSVPAAAPPGLTPTSPLYTTGDKWQDKKKQTQVRYFNDLRSVQLRRVNPPPGLISTSSSNITPDGNSSTDDASATI